MIKKILLASAISLSMMFSSGIYADHGPENCGCMHMKKMVSELNLTPEQQEKIKQIKEQVRANMQENMQAMQDINSKIRTLVQSEKMDPAELDKLVNQKTALIGAKIKNKIMIKNQMYNMLTPEQKAKFTQAMDEMKQKYNEIRNSNGDEDLVDD